MGKYKVIIIDDEPWTREVVRKLGHFQELGMEIIGEASDGEYGLELIHQTQPDIIITDVRMPNLGGLELIQKLKEEGSEAYIIVISGYDDYAYIRSALKLGVIDYLLKPIKPGELNAQLEQCLGRLQERSAVEYENWMEAFPDVSWAAEYHVLLDRLYDSLFSGETAVIEQQFCAIRKLIYTNDFKKMHKRQIVYLYYSLINVLQKYISNSGYHLTEILENADQAFVFSNDSTAEQVFHFMNRICSAAVESVQKQIKNRNKLDIKQIEVYLHERFCEGITLEQTADRFYVSKEYLSKLFKAETGKGFSEYVAALRMEHAKKLILEYKVPIKEAGALVGYQDQAHFYKAFKKYFGVTPGNMKANSDDNSASLKIDNKTGQK